MVRSFFINNDRRSLVSVPRLCLLLFFISLQGKAQLKPTPAVGALKWQLAHAQQDSTRLRSQVAIGNYYLTVSQFDSLYLYTQRGLQLLKTVRSAYYAGDLYYFLAKYYRHRHQYQLGIVPMRQAIRYALQAHSVKKTVLFQYALAVLYSDASNLPKAIDQIAINLKYLRKYPDNGMLSANYLLIIELYKELDNPAMQTLYTNRYLALVTPGWPAVDQMMASGLKAERLEKEGHLLEAAQLYKQALVYAHQTHSPVYVIVVLNKQGTNLLNRHRDQQALVLFKEAFNRAQAIQDNYIMAEAKRGLALSNLSLKQPQQALNEARYALSLARQNNQLEGLLASLQVLFVVLKANGHYKEASMVYEEETQRKERHFNEKNMHKIAYMQAEFDAENQANIIKIQQNKLTLLKQTQLAMLVIVSLLAILIGVIYYFLRKTQRTNLILTQQGQLMQQTVDELAETNTVKDKLFSLISHDLRSPVASLKSNIHQIRTTGRRATLPLMLNRLESQVDTVLTLLTNLLDWSAIQLKGFRLILQPINLYDLTEVVLSQANSMIQQKQLIVLNQVNKAHYVLADKYQLEAVLRNLLSNAIKFSPPGGYIRIFSIGSDQQIEWLIRDIGQGMSAHQLDSLLAAPHLKKGTLGESGTGLGLRICQDILTQLNGTLTMENHPKGGMLARVRVPAYIELPVTVLN